jgi:chemotaxis protein methyltransferase CheR
VIAPAGLAPRDLAGLPALSAAAGLPLETFRAEHVAEQVRRALAREGLESVDRLAQRLRTDADSRARFRRGVAVSVTGLFRDPTQFELLERELLPPLLARGGRLRVWSAGASDGSELASIGILLARHGALERAFLLGSDLLAENVQWARATTVAPADVRSLLRWEQRDLVADGAPVGRWHLVLCRNVAIYLTRHARRALHETLAAALAPDGVLLLGRSERLLDPRALGLVRAAPHAYRKAAS